MNIRIELNKKLNIYPALKFIFIKNNAEKGQKRKTKWFH